MERLRIIGCNGEKITSLFHAHFNSLDVSAVQIASARRKVQS